MISISIIHLNAPQNPISCLSLQHPLLRIHRHVQLLLQVFHIPQVCARSGVEVDRPAEIHPLCGGYVNLLMGASPWRGVVEMRQTVHISELFLLEGGSVSEEVPFSCQ